LLMFHNLGKGQFEKLSDGALGPDFSRPIAGRGLATADFDNDGDIDIAINVRGDYPELLRNDGGNQNHWLEVLLIGTRSNRDGIGASLKLTSEGFVHVEQSKGGMSYMSASDPRIFFGLGKRTKIDSLEITWPSNQVDKLTNHRRERRHRHCAATISKGSEPMKRWNFVNVAEFVNALPMDCSAPDLAPSQASGWKSHRP
jgi:hypothetical protein